MSKQTPGQYLVGLGFNPSGDPLIDEIKQKAAELIDLIEPLLYKKGVERNGVRVLNFSAIVAADTAIRRVEEATMWAVKSVTQPYPESIDE